MGKLKDFYVKQIIHLKSFKYAKKKLFQIIQLKKLLHWRAAVYFSIGKSMQSVHETGNLQCTRNIHDKYIFLYFST